MWPETTVNLKAPGPELLALRVLTRRSPRIGPERAGGRSGPGPAQSPACTRVAGAPFRPAGRATSRWRPDPPSSFQRRRMSAGTSSSMEGTMEVRSLLVRFSPRALLGP
jgi:hypothetical protein